MQTKWYLFSRHIPEMLKEYKHTNVAYESSSSGTENTFNKSARHYPMKTVAVIGFLAIKGEILT